MPRWLRIVLGVVLGLVLLMAAAVFVLTNTSFGREKVGHFVLGQLRNSLNGQLEVGSIQGNLLTGARLVDVELTDSTGNTFLVADTIVAHYSLSDIIHKHLVLRNVRLVNLAIVLNRPPGGEWNYKHVLKQKPGTAADTIPGFGSWIRLVDTRIRRGEVVVRMPWSPPDSLSGAAREAAIRTELSPSARPWVVRVPGGYQRIEQLYGIDAYLPMLRVANPDTASRLIAIDSLQMLALPYRPPVARIQQLAGRFVMGPDSIELHNLVLALPGTRIEGEGAYVMNGGGLRLHASAPSIAFPDFHFFRPSLPPGGGTLQGGVLARRQGHTRLQVQQLALHTEGAKVLARGAVQLGTTTQLGPAHLSFSGITTGLIERFMPSDTLPVHGSLAGDLDLSGRPAELSLNGHVRFNPVHGLPSTIAAHGGLGTATGGGVQMRDLTLRLMPFHLALARQVIPSLPAGVNGTVTGTATLTGSTRSAVSVDADLIQHDPSAGESHLLARGDLGLKGSFRAEGLHLRLEPLQLAAVKPMMPGLPVEGTLSGTATITGAPSKRLSAVVDLVHHGPAGPSHFIGTAERRPGPPASFALDLRTPELALGTIDRVVPMNGGLHGTAHGTVSVHGTMARMQVAVDLGVVGDGDVATTGTLALRQTPRRYDLAARFDHFDASAASTRAPQTLLTGTASVAGAGTHLATMDATVRADMVDLAVRGRRLDSTHVAVRLQNGVADVRRGQVRMNSLAADAHGRFGLVAGTSGTLTYDIRLDSLGAYSSAFPSGTGVVAPRPASQARALARAKRDSARLARQTEVQRMAVGYPPPPRLRLDTIPPLPRDSVAGSVRARGTITGNIHRFDTRGSATVDHVVMVGSAVAHAAATYQVRDFGTDSPAVVLAGTVDTLRTRGFTFDSADVRLAYTGKTRQGHGTADIALFQDTATEYRLGSSFSLSLNRNHAQLNRVLLRFDTTTWRSTRTSAIDWGGPGLSVDSLSLASNAGGRVILDGQVPVSGPADMTLDVDSLALGQVTTLIQDTTPITGLLSLHAGLRGPRSSPQLRATVGLVHGSWGTIALPRAHARLDYADRRLTTHATLARSVEPAAPVVATTAGATPAAGGGAVTTDTLVVADATLPFDLSLTSVPGSRRLPGPISVDVRADSLPADLLSRVSSGVSDVHGGLAGDLTVRGTWNEPVTRGDLRVDLSSLRVAYTGVDFNAVTGALVLRGDSARVDSLVARTGPGSFIVSGGIGLKPLSSPAFDLTVRSRNALVFDNSLGRVRADGDLDIGGRYPTLDVTGQVHILGGAIYAPAPTSIRHVTNLQNPEIAPAIDTSAVRPGVLPTSNPLLSNLTADVRVSIARNTWVRNTDGNVEVYTGGGTEPLHIRMSHGRQNLTLRGVVNADRGEYTYAGRLFRLTSGAITFTGAQQIDPLLHINGEYDVPRQDRETLLIQIHVLGTARQPRISLESNAQPPLPQSELISYLAFGRTSSSLLSLQGSGLTAASGGADGLPAIAQQQLTGLALGSFMDREVSQIQRSGTRAGLDVFRIHPASLPTELSFDGYFQNFLRSTEVEAGKYVSPRIYLGLQERISSGIPGIRVEYRTPGHFSWETTWQPRYLPSDPSLTLQTPTLARSFGTFLFWTHRF